MPPQLLRYVVRGRIWLVLDLRRTQRTEWFVGAARIDGGSTGVVQLQRFTRRAGAEWRQVPGGRTYLCRGEIQLLAAEFG